MAARLPEVVHVLVGGTEAARSGMRLSSRVLAGVFHKCTDVGGLQGLTGVAFRPAAH
jgi:hypothetical protein